MADRNARPERGRGAVVTNALLSGKIDGLSRVRSGIGETQFQWRLPMQQQFPKLRFRCVALILFSTTTACAPQAGGMSLLDYALAVPQRYESMSCTEILGRAKSSAARANELSHLMEVSGNRVINAIAYDTDYAKAAAAQHAAEQAARDKGCDDPNSGGGQGPLNGQK